MPCKLNFLLADGSIKILCEIECLQNSKNEFKENFPASTSQILTTIWNNVPDCIIQIDSEKINAHRSILSQHSEVFRRMFEQNGMIEGQSGIVKIDDCSPECFKAMLEYCYTGKVSESKLEELSEDLFAVSHKYQLTSLKEICEHFIASNISIEKLHKFCFIIYLYGSSILEEDKSIFLACIKFILANRNTLLRPDNEKWKNLKIEFSDLTHRFLESMSNPIEKTNSFKNSPFKKCSFIPPLYFIFA
ncbi:hypothetical protein Mgra_00003749 [Meloidogyne graminicola]|uniref:BTB domain-containing protein n=1 Tax=Meloidogyne graminicola TaxID=189291 RepID=A0A8S9ZUK4_9BILA|nr:hypothetical protein Mgra_00003749 [Meloidogyne graminicola]